MVNKKSVLHNDEFLKLKEMVKQHKVCWEVGPEYFIDSEKNTIQIGFTLYLYGTHYHPEKVPIPGCS